MNDAQATQAMASALDAAKIPYTPDQAESVALGREWVAPAVATAPAERSAVPAATPLSPEQQLAALNAPDLGLRGEATAIEAMRAPSDSAAYQIQGVHGAERDAVHSALADLQLPVGLGRHLAATVMKGGKAPIATPEQAQAALEKSTAHLQRTWGAEAPARIKEVQGHIAKIGEKHPWLIPSLERSGAHRDSWLMIQLWNTLSAQRAPGK